ncbi:hypothetical protein DYB30_000926 [Aphanomyces astaci]|uniref:COP9 signalosome complex subunit 3 N-terminal helical repeats domain-containing protein n=1 Tax=Aphanomyces astaci TaxID=112090 RepID=A0A397DVE6_APHAT|nr:hypothetical protein DYB36_002846 [Aphanomyces astaci]RHY45103.1 hypothetical protein DYB30_000926 [Aphanomyces astaci]RHY68080.1 hypothetical protein DYB38_010486 [Aphanomyces astaci]
MAAIAEFILTHCKHSGGNMVNGDLPQAIAQASVEELDDTLECLNAIEYAAAMALAKGKKLHIHGGGDGGDRKVDEDDDDVDMGTPASVHDDHHVSFLLEVAAYLSQLSSLPVEPKDAITLDELVRLAVQVGIARGAAIRLVHPLRQLLLRWQSSGPAHPNSLTPLHSSFALACVHAKCYHIAIAILDQCVHSTSPSIFFLTNQ